MRKTTEDIGKTRDERESCFPDRVREEARP